MNWVFEKNITRVLFCTVAGASLAGIASAQELVSNGGFETGNFNGWTQGLDANGFVVGSPVHTGSSSYKLTPGSSTNSLSQILATSIGATYQYSVWLDHEGGDNTSNFAEIDWNGSAVFGSAPLVPSSGWVNYLFTVTATSTSTAINVTAHDPVGNIYLDDVSVVQTVPEPASFAVLGLGAIALIRRRRTK